MNASEMERFHRLFEELLQALKLHGLRPKTIDSYCRSIRRVANHFGRTPDDLKPDELKSYFSSLIESYSWSTIKVDLSALQFLHRYVLGRLWKIKPVHGRISL
jgi:integrase/recombinase XerD